jgi:hypothetical protein
MPTEAEGRGTAPLGPALIGTACAAALLAAAGYVAWRVLRGGRTPPSPPAASPSLPPPPVLSSSPAPVAPATTPEAAPRLVVHVFYSSAETAIREAEPALAALAARWGERVRIVRGDIEAPAEYERLRSLERDFGVTQGFAAVEVFVSAEGTEDPLEGVALLGAARLGALERIAARVLGPAPEIPPLPEEELYARAAEVFGKTLVLSPAGAGAGRWREVRNAKGGGGDLLGHLREVRERSGCVACEDAHFLLVVGPEGRVLRVLPVIPLEHPAAGVTEERTGAFLGGFAGRAPGEPLVLGRDLDGITGATKTSRLYARAVRAALSELAAANGAR